MVEYLENFLTNIAVKEFWKSVHICQSYDKKSSVLFFWDTVYMRRSVKTAVENFAQYETFNYDRSRQGNNIVSQQHGGPKSKPPIFVTIFAECWPIFKILRPTHFVENLQQREHLIIKYRLLLAHRYIVHGASPFVTKEYCLMLTRIAIHHQQEKQ